MTNLKYRVDSDGELACGHAGEDAPQASSDNAVASAQPTPPQVQDQTLPLNRELEPVKAKRLMKDIEAAGVSGGVQSILENSSAAMRDPGCMLADAEGQRSPGAHAGQRESRREASETFESLGEGQQWILPSLLAVLAISLGIFFLVNFSEVGDHPFGADGASLPATASHGQSALNSTTRSKLAELNRQVIFWMTQYSDGFNPRKVTLKRVRADLALSSGQMLDSWGRPIKYEAADAGYTLRSSGADKEFNTDDDLVELQPQFPSHLQPARQQQPLPADSHS